MTVKQKAIRGYLEKGSDLIPINPWNKMVKGKQRGKTPVHDNWPKRQYTQDEIQRYMKQGFNIGYRIPEDELVIDIDPRNFEGEEVLEPLAESLGFFDFDEMVEEWPVVKTGGGGYHFYTKLPDDFLPEMIRETIEEFPGVEFKKVGRQVLCAGSKHPDGNYYKWLHKTKSKPTIPGSFLELIKRERNGKVNLGDKEAGYGSLNGEQLREMILSKLNVEDYRSNDKWFPLLCAAHHVTAGNGVDEFLEWSLGDEKYESSENEIRNRWESLNNKGNTITVGTLIRELESRGEETGNLKAVLSFANVPKVSADEEESEEAELLEENDADIDVEDIFNVKHEDNPGVEGAALQAANNLSVHSNDEDVMKVLRLIKAAGQIESEKAISVIVANKVLSKASVNKLLNSLDAKIIDDLALLLAQKTLDKTFNEGKHLTVTPNGECWAFHKTHWKPMSDEFMAKLIQKMLSKMKQKMSIEMQELSLIQQAVRLARIEVATLNDRIHRTEVPLPVINCLNGEIWLNKDGSHSLRPHNYRSYLLHCLNVNYNPTAECPVFMETLEEIFGHFPDTDDMIRHVGEIMGYVAQPYKNIASWWLFRGPGGDGKSTILKILEGVLKDAQLNTTTKLLSMASSDGYSHAAMSLVGVLAVVIEELPSGYLLREAGVKMLSENTKMEANPKGKGQFNFMYAGGLLMCSNSFPATRDLSHGMMRRANVIPFNRQFTKEGIEDTNRAERILNDPEEMSGVLNFMLEGLQRLRDRGRFQEPESCMAAKLEWLNEGNNVARFVHETIEQTDDKDTKLDNGNEVVTRYHDWCQLNGVKPKGRNTFYNDLKELGLEIKKPQNKTTVYGGTWIDLPIDDFEDLDDDDWS